MLLIPLGLVIAAKPTWATFGIGLAVAVVGQWVRIWAAGHIHKTEILAVGGPFAYVRNPLYVGTLLMGVGYCIITNQWWCWPLAFLLYFGVHYPTIFSEERVLAETFGEDYQRYLKAIPRLIPTFRAYAEATGRFSWGQVLYNKEYRGLSGFVLASILFAVRAYFNH